MNLLEYYKLIFDVTQYHQFSVLEIEQMIPFERNLYVDMLAEKVKQENNQ